MIRWLLNLLGVARSPGGAVGLRLKYPPTPDNAPRFAADIAASAAELSGATLDYSAASLEAVDDIVEGFRQDGCTPQQVAETLFGFGCYVGEVLVRQAGGRWRPAADTSFADLGGFPLVVEMGPGDYCNPIGKVFKRLENGPEDSLPFFYQVLAGPRQDAEPGAAADGPAEPGPPLS